jgi:hypothetical protein
LLGGIGEDRVLEMVDRKNKQFSLPVIRMDFGAVDLYLVLIGVFIGSSYWQHLFFYSCCFPVTYLLLFCSLKLCSCSSLSFYGTTCA